MRVLGFGTYDAHSHPRIAVLLTGLSRNGVEVSQVNAPLGFSTAERVAMAQRPWLAYRLVARLARRWATLIRHGLGSRRAGNRLDAVLVGYLGHFDVVLARLLFPRTTIVLDHLIFAADTAADRGVSGGRKLWLLRRLDRLAIRCANIVLLDTEEHTALLTAREQDKAVVVAVGAPYDWFVAQSPHVVQSPHVAQSPHVGHSPHVVHSPHQDPDQREPAAPLRVVFFGLFTPLQGAPVIARAWSALPATAAITLSLLGSGQDLDTVRKIIGADDRVSWRDWVDPADLPAEVARHDVCLGIFSSTPKGQRVVPNKVYQGAAAGCAIVTSDTGPQRRALGEAAMYVAPGDAQALAELLADLAADPDRLVRFRAAARDLANDAFRPEQVVRPLLAALTRTAIGPGSPGMRSSR